MNKTHEDWLNEQIGKLSIKESIRVDSKTYIGVQAIADLLTTLSTEHEIAIREAHAKIDGLEEALKVCSTEHAREVEKIKTIIDEVDFSYTQNDGRDAKELYGGQMAACEIRRRLLALSPTSEDKNT